jgi:DTW domain-containing protein
VNPTHPQLGPHRGVRCSPRCGRCALPPDLCLCAEVRALELRTRVVVVAHRREVHKTTNTARLVPIALSNSEVRVVGLPEERARYRDLVPEDTLPLLLFPSTDSLPLTPELVGTRRVTLVVPDGNWRQASKMARNEPELARLPRVRLSGDEPSRYLLRSHPDASRLATFEAIARALGVLEGDDVRGELERVLALKVERTLWTRRRPKRETGNAGP